MVSCFFQCGGDVDVAQVAILSAWKGVFVCFKLSWDLALQPQNRFLQMRWKLSSSTSWLLGFGGGSESVKDADGWATVQTEITLTSFSHLGKVVQVNGLSGHQLTTSCSPSRTYVQNHGDRVGWYVTMLAAGCSSTFQQLCKSTACGPHIHWFSVDATQNEKINHRTYS